MSDDATVHVYANGRRFVIVPVISSSDEEDLEIEPVQPVPLTLGRPTVVRLARALRAARRASRGAKPSSSHWDGEKGRWWTHHLLGLTVRWTENQIALTDLRERDSVLATLPTDTADTELSERLIELLGQKLHAA